MSYCAYDIVILVESSFKSLIFIPLGKHRLNGGAFFVRKVIYEKR